MSAIRAAAANANLYFPLSISSEGSCTVGGNLATNAGGSGVFRYGSMRDLTLGLEFVAADGAVHSSLSGLRKDNTGLDLRHLIIGSEGTLGVITAATLRLLPSPADRQTVLCLVQDPAAAVELLQEARRGGAGNFLSMCELMPAVGIDLVAKHYRHSDPFATAPHPRCGPSAPWYVLLEFEGGHCRGDLNKPVEIFLQQVMENNIGDQSRRTCSSSSSSSSSGNSSSGSGGIGTYSDKTGSILDAVWATNETQAQAMRALRENLSSASLFAGVSIKHDISVPVPVVPEFIKRADAVTQKVVPGARPIPFGHIGDGNIHYNVSQPLAVDGSVCPEQGQDFEKKTLALNRAVYQIVYELGGSISAEHGIGIFKRDELEHFKDAADVNMMRAIKKALDPLNILNPGRIFRV